MTISIYAVKAFARIQYPFMIETFTKLGKEAKFLNLIKNVYQTPTASITGNGEKPEAYPLRSERRQGHPLAPPGHHGAGSLPSYSRREKEVIVMQIGKEEWEGRRLSYPVGDMIVYVDKSRMLERTWSNENSPLLLAGMQMVQPPWKTVGQFLTKD